MNKRVFCIIGAAVLLAFLFPVVPLAQSPVQLSVFNPIQLVSEFDSVRGVSLGLIYTVNNDMTGFNLTLGANKLYGDMKGVQIGLINMNEGDVRWFQTGAYNRVNGNVYGWQNGLINYNDGLTKGLQTGVLNMTGDLRGLQIGFMNTTDTLYGIQLGLINLNASGDPFGFLPIINFGF